MKDYHIVIKAVVWTVFNKTETLTYQQIKSVTEENVACVLF